MISAPHISIGSSAARGQGKASARNFPGRRKLIAFLEILLLGICFRTSAQEFDAVVTEQNRKSPSVADEIRDPAERESFLELFKKHDPIETVKLAEAFLGRYPQSWELAQVYSIAAKADIDLGNYSQALHDARQSLALYPENPVLLVPVANVEAQVKHWAEAKQNAQDALLYLHRFTRPSSVSEREWPRLKRQLEASAYFALGRAQISEALNSEDSARRAALLPAAAEDLRQARSLNPRDPEIAYLLALADLALHQPQDAALNFAAAAQETGALQTTAILRLQKLYTAFPPRPAVSFEVYLKTLEAQAEAAGSTQRARTESQPAEALSGYAGSQACQYCHGNIYNSWTHTGMAKMFRPYTPQNVIGDFTVHNEFYAGDAASFENGRFRVTPGKRRWLFARMLIIHGRPYFETREYNGQWRTYPVDYTIGSKWEQAYATRLPDGEIQVFPIQYNALLRRWVDFWSVIDPPGSPRADLDEWGKVTVWTDYQANCAVCHTSQLRNVAGGGFAPTGLAFREPGVDCEMCHGPSARHAAAMMKGQPYPKPPLDPPVDFSKISASDFIAICSQCHMQSAVRSPGPKGELNYSTRGEFFMRYQSRFYGEFSRLGFYKDGRFRQTTFIVEALTRSECYRKGHVTCGDCHDVHGPNASSNPTSLKFPGESDLMCTQCHTVFKDRAALVGHTHHLYQSEGSRCVSCHMPRVMDALLFTARTHRIDDIPNAANTLRFGQQDSPNACLLCHTQKDARWVNEQMVDWKGGLSLKPGSPPSPPGGEGGQRSFYSRGQPTNSPSRVSGGIN